MRPEFVPFAPIHERASPAPAARARGFRALRRAMALVLLVSPLAGTAYAGRIVGGASLKVRDLELAVPTGWTIHQETANGDGAFAGMRKDKDPGGAYVRVYAWAGDVADVAKAFQNDATVLGAVHAETIAGKEWQWIETAKTPRRGLTTHVAGAWGQIKGRTYVAYSRAADVAAARANLKSALANVRP